MIPSPTYPGLPEALAVTYRMEEISAELNRLASGELPSLDDPTRSWSDSLERVVDTFESAEPPREERPPSRRAASSETLPPMGIAAWLQPRVESRLQEPGPIERMVREAARRHGVDPALLSAVARAESNLNPMAVSPAGAVGVMQLMPGTAKALGVGNPFDAGQNIDSGARYLRQLLDRFGGDARRALAAYNAGPNAVTRYGGVPPFRETQTFVERVLALKANLELAAIPTEPTPPTLSPPPAAIPRATAAVPHPADRMPALPAPAPDPTVPLIGAVPADRAVLEVSPTVTIPRGDLTTPAPAPAAPDPEPRVSPGLSAPATVPAASAGAGARFGTGHGNSERDELSQFREVADDLFAVDPAAPASEPFAPAPMRIEGEGATAATGASPEVLSAESASEAWERVAMRAGELSRRGEEFVFRSRVSVPHAGQGHVDLEVAGRGPQVTVVMQVESGPVGDALRAELDLLQRSLEANGLALAGFHVGSEASGAWTPAPRPTPPDAWSSRTPPAAARPLLHRIRPGSTGTLNVLA